MTSNTDDRTSAQPQGHVHGPDCNHDHDHDHHGHVHGPHCNHGPHHFAPVEQYRRAAPKVGRNDPCICGSGKKHKKCCMAT